MRAILVLAVVAVLASAVAAGPAAAAFPGTNGKLVFTLWKPTFRSFPNPDGTWVGNGSNYLAFVNADGTGLTGTRGGFWQNGNFPAWSADGRRLVYTDNGDTHVTVVNADGTGSRAVTVYQPGVADSHPAWSPDATKIVFTRQLTSPISCCPDIWVVGADGTGLTRLTSDGGFEPSWSPDGKKIAYQRNGSIAVMNPDGSGVTVVGPGTAADWSPDGSKFAFRRGNQIWIMNADGSGARQITSRPTINDDPAWSPDGSKITFRSNRTADDRLQGYQLWDVYVMNTDGTGVTMVASEPAGNAMDASWQPIPVPHPAGAAFDAIDGVRSAVAAKRDALTTNHARRMLDQALASLDLALEPARWRNDGIFASTDAGLTGMRLLRVAVGRLDWTDPQVRAATQAERVQIVSAMATTARTRFAEAWAARFQRLPNDAFLYWRAERHLDRADADANRVRATIGYIEAFRILLGQPPA